MIYERTQILIYGDGQSKRVYTYIDDIATGIIGELKYDKKNMKYLVLAITNLSS